MKKLIKKSTSLLLIFAMLATVLVMFPMGVSAATTTDAVQAAAGKNCRIGTSMEENTYYTSLWNAYNAMSDGDTIYMINDITTGTFQLKISTIKNITIDGQGFTYKNSSNSEWCFNLHATECLTVRNCNFVALNGFYTEDSKGAGNNNKIIIENCTITGQTISAALTGDDPANYLFRGRYGHTELVIKDTTITNGVGISTFYYVEESAPTKISLINSTIISNGTQYTEYKSKGNYVDYSNKYAIFGGWGSDVDITVDGKSKIVQNAKGDGTRAYAPVFSIGSATNNIVLEAGATIEIGSSNVLKNEIVHDNIYSITDKGANWVMSADIAKAGIKMPTTTTPAELTFCGVGEQTANGFKVIEKPTTYQNTEATDKVTLTTLALDENAITNKFGASIRTEDPYGIRFTGVMSDMLYNIITNYATDVSFGMLIAPSEKVATNGFDLDNLVEDTDYKEIICTSYDKNSKDGNRFYRLALYDIEKTKADLTYEYSATAFVKFTIGETEYALYADYSADASSRSLHDVAKAAFADGLTDNDIINEIIAIAEA